MDVTEAPRALSRRAHALRAVPASDWREVLTRAWRDSREDHVPLLAAGVAFWSFLSLFPALIATLSVYGLVADPDQVANQVERVAGALPPQSRKVLSEQLSSIASSAGGALSVGLVVSLGVALFSASGGTMNLVKAVNVAYDEDETRSFVRLRLLALALTVGAILFAAVAVGALVVVPALLRHVGLGGVAGAAVQVGRWALLVAFVPAALAVVYRIAPDRTDPRARWLAPGALVATVVWLVGSALFTVYVVTLGSYGGTYGALAGAVVLLLWLLLTSFAVLFGAEFNSEAERMPQALGLHDDPACSA